MVKMSYDVVKRWVNEAQEAASSDNIMVQVSAGENQIGFNAVRVDVWFHSVPVLEFSQERPARINQ